MVEGEKIVGNVRIKRQYVTSKANGGVNDEKMFVLHTHVRDLSVPDEELRATIAIVHGFAENSDIHLESAIQYALNKFDVHLVDLRGYGLSAGFRMIHTTIMDFHYDVTALLKQVSPTLPLFIYGHSMGGLTVATYLLNNTNLNISGAILSAPLLNFHKSKGVNEPKKLIVNMMAEHLEVRTPSFIIYFHIGILC